jgi:GTP cyclohydrolase FolE2
MTRDMTPDDLDHDVPAQRPEVPLDVDRVSITNQRAPFSIVDPLIDRTEVLCEVRVGCDLPATHRGIHMSRIEQALAVTIGQVRTLPVTAVLVAMEVARSQARPRAWADLRGEVVLTNRTTVTGLVSRDRAVLGAHAALDPDLSTLSISLTCTSITACPCMQAYALDDLIVHFTGGQPSAAAGPAARAKARAAVPIATHSQKGRITLTVTMPVPDLSVLTFTTDEYPQEMTTTVPTYADLHQIVSVGTTLTSELLKRPDEYDLVKRAHARAQFVEDVVRDTAAAAMAHSALPDVGRLAVHATSFESIHGHDIEASLTRDLGDLRDILTHRR